MRPKVRREAQRLILFASVLIVFGPFSGTPSPPPEAVLHPPGVLEVAQRLYTDWRVGNLSGAGSVATHEALADLLDMPSSGARPDVCLQSTPGLWECTPRHPTQDFIQFEVELSPNGYRVVHAFPCVSDNRSLPAWTCYMVMPTS